MLTKTFWLLLAAALFAALFVRDLTIVWFAVVALAIAGAAVVAINWAVLIRYVRTSQHASTIPVVGGVSLAVAMARSPIPSFRLWCWLPLFIDPACVPLLVALAWRLRKRDAGPS